MRSSSRGSERCIAHLLWFNFYGVQGNGAENEPPRGRCFERSFQSAFPRVVDQQKSARGLLLVLAVASVAGPASAQTEGADPPPTAESRNKKGYPIRPTIFGRPLRFSGFHFHASLGVGAGPGMAGLYHAMELGYSFSCYSVSLLHTFLQNKGVFGDSWGGPDEIGGFMIQARGPLYFEDLSWKFAAGVGGTVDQSDGFDANPGFGVHYGVDLHFPIWTRFGPTLSLDAMNVFSQGHHHFGAGLALGFSIF